jgi:hypothetical protein
MVIYEVNLTINNDIFSDYYHWLVEHVEKILQIQGFLKAEIAEEKNLDTSAGTTKLTVRYSLESEKDLDDYFTHHASAMREEGLRKFGDKFSAARRVFLRTLEKKLTA